MARSLTLVVALACAGCSALATSGLPFMSARTTVGAVETHGGYRIAPIRDAKEELILMFPDTEVCRTVVQPEAEVTYTQVGVPGRVTRGDARCDPIGIASLAEWRDRRSQFAAGIPRDVARFTKIHQDDDVILLRGQFLIAGQIRWIGDDTVAMLPATPGCQAVADRGEWTVEFRKTGDVAFRFVGADCAIGGFARPLPGSR
jgi:hypothetical protein